MSCNRCYEQVANAINGGVPSAGTSAGPSRCDRCGRFVGRHLVCHQCAAAIAAQLTDAPDLEPGLWADGYTPDDLEHDLAYLNTALNACGLPGAVSMCWSTYDPWSGPAGDSFLIYSHRNAWADADALAMVLIDPDASLADYADAIARLPVPENHDSLFCTEYHRQFIGAPYSTCADCGAVHDDNALDPIADLSQRVSAGEPMPSGQCPTCGALTHQSARWPPTPRTPYNRSAQRFQCQNCQAAWSQDDLMPIQDLEQRVDPNCPVSPGECPTCGALCYPSP
jgi:hypothetical protein